jgi:hypothetical protein
MSFPPGILYVSKLLPGVLGPPLGTYFLKWLLETCLDVGAPRWVFVPVCLLSFPFVFTCRVQYKMLADRRAAAALGAVLPPFLPSSIGGIDLILGALRRMGTQFPGSRYSSSTSSLAENGQRRRGGGPNRKGKRTPLRHESSV